MGKTKSNVWKYFTRSNKDDNGKTINQAKCNSCPAVIKQESANGTSNLWRHFNKFHKQEDGAVGASRSPAPPTCNPSGSGASKDSKPVMIDADKANRCLAEMIADSGYDPAIIEDVKFKAFAQCLNPSFKMPSRRAIEEICDDIILSLDDMYTDGTDSNFSLSVRKTKTMDREVLYVAFHYINLDVDLGEENYCWKMVRCAYEVALEPRDEYCHCPLSGLPVASLGLVAANIVSEIPGGAVVFMMACEETDLTFVHNLKERIKLILGSRMSKEPFCATYMDQVIHYIARCLLPDLDFTSRMYSIVNDLKLTRQDRKDLMKECGLDDPWEYNEIWYSCYCSLEVLRKRCSSTIATTDFEVIGILCDIWGKFYRSIKRISDTYYLATSHLCLAELFKLREALQSGLESATVYFVNNLERAIVTLDKAIKDSYMVWSIPLAMDPRYKLEYVEVIFETAFGSEVAGDYIAKVKGNIEDLYRNYDARDYCTIDTNVGSADRVQQAWNKRRRGQAKTDLDRYLQDTLVPEEQFESDFEDSIMCWWKTAGSASYPKVARMAWDALAMPTSSKVSPADIAEVKSIIRGYSRKRSIARQEEEEGDEEEYEDNHEEEEEEYDNRDGNADAMNQELN